MNAQPVMAILVRERVRARPRGHPGVRSPRLQDADGAAFLVDGSETRHKRAGNSDGSSAATNPTSRKSRLPRTGTWGSRPDRETISPMPRVARPTIASTSVLTWPGLVALEIEERVPTLSFKSFGAFVEGAAQRAALVGDTGASSPQNWIGGFGSGDDHVLVTLHAISPEAMTSYTDRLCAWFAEGNAFREIWRQDGMALMEMQDGQPVPTAKVHFGYTDGITTPTIRGGPESISARSPTALRAMALRPAGRRRELPGTRAASTGPERQLRGLQEGRDRRRRLRRLLAVEQGQDRSRTAGRKDVRAMAQRRSARRVAGHGQPCGRDLARTVERFRVCQRRWFGRSEGDPLSRRRTHTPRQSTRSTGRGPGSARAAATILTG